MRLRADLLPEPLDLLLLVPPRAQREARFPGKQRLRALPSLQRLQQLREDAAHGPHVDGGVVVLLQEDQFGRAVPARDDMLGQLAMDVGGLRTGLGLVEEIGVFDFHLGLKEGNGETVVSLLSLYCWFIWRARPKSIILATQRSLTRILEGLRSRWTRLPLCEIDLKNKKIVLACREGRRAIGTKAI